MGNMLKWRELIAERELFSNHDATLSGEYVDGLLPGEDAGALVNEDLDRFTADAPFIDYVVRSYRTPIYWVCYDGRDYVIEEAPSKTTAGHRNLCPGRRQTRERSKR